MKENQYDQPEFFEKYAALPRSQEGLPSAGEWHALKTLLPPLAGKRVLDLGCGYGWHTEYCAQAGARRIVGVDLSSKMLEVAKRAPHAAQIEYLHCAIEDYAYPKEAFDLVLSSLALHYVRDFRDVVHQVVKTLAPSGSFLFSVEHPVFTAQGHEQWVSDQNGEPLYWPVDRYFDEGLRETVFLEHNVVKYHRTLTTLLSALIEENLNIMSVIEPQPAPELLDLPGMRDELRRPMMLIISAQKPVKLPGC